MALHAGTRRTATEEQYAPIIVEDLVNGVNDWKHVHDIVRLTFKSISDVLRSQGAAISELERQLPTKVSKSEFSAALSAKPNLSDISKLFKESTVSGDKGLPSSAVETLLKEKVSKTELQSYLKSAVTDKDLRAVVDQKLSTRHFESEMSALQERLQELRQENAFHISRLETEIAELCKLLDLKADLAELEKVAQGKANRQSVINALHAKANREEFEVALGRKANVEHVEECVNEIKTLRSAVEAVGTRSGDVLQEVRREMHAPLQRIQRDLDSVSSSLSLKADTDKFSVALSTLKQELSALEDHSTAFISDISKKHELAIKSLEAQVARTQDSVYQLSRDVVTMKPEGDSQRFISLLEEVNRRKADVSELVELRRLVMDAKGRSSPDTATLHRADIDRITALVLQDVSQYVDTALRSTHKDFSRAVDSKANFDDISQTLLEIHKDIESRVPQVEFQRFVAHVDLLIAESCVARWLWTSGMLPGDKRIGWDVQTVNTREENFLWAQGESEVCAVAPGLYEVAVGVFARTRPRVQVLVNGQALYRLGYTETESVKQWTPHPDGNIIGLTLTDVVALPTRARLSVTVDSEWRAEAFLSLRKL